MPTLTLSPVVADDISEGVVVSSPEGLRLPADTADPNHEHWLREHGMSIAVPLRDDTGTVHGLLCARRNAGADILDRGEFELVRSFCFQATAVLQHLHLQEQMMFEQRKRREVQELNRLKSHFVASVSHDLRTPLTSIGMFLELLEQQNVPVKKRVEYIEFIRQEAVRLRQLVNNVLDFARAERGMQEFTSAPTNLGVVLRGAAEAMKGQCTATRTHYIVRIPGSLPQIQADGQALERAFVNLLSNAHKYTPAKKRISFTARRDGDRVLVKVADNGFGIPKKDLNRIFDPFFRVRDLNTTPTGGVGLGLSLVKRTIEHHGGTISVHSRQGKGTTVTVSLPIDRPPA